MSGPPPPHTEGRASGQGRVFQSSGDQHITEHHHHYAPGPGASLFTGTSPSDPLSAAGIGPDSVRIPLVGRVPSVLRDRADLMRRLRTALDGGGGQIHVLHGMGGCGKTAVAHALFAEAVHDRARIGLWVNASERLSLRAGMLAVAADRGASPGELAAAHSGQRAAADLVWHHLDRSPEPWLLVIDNADDPAILEEGGWLRAGPRGTVLVTTRYAASRVWRGAILHPVDVLPSEDAAQVLCDLAPHAGTPAAAELVAVRLGCLPLALTLAGSYLHQQLLESWSMDEYRTHLEDDPIGLIDQGAALDSGRSDSRHLVSRTWQLSLDALADQGLPEATTLLRLLSCWSADPLPLAVLSPASLGGTGLLDSGRVEPALRGLIDHSLATIVSAPPGADGERPVRCVQVHGVLLDSISSGIPADQRAALTEAAASLLEAALPAEAGSGDRFVALLVPHAVRLLRRVDGGAVDQVVDLAVRLSERIHETGDYAAALALAQQAAGAGERMLGAEHPLTLSALHRVGRSLFRLGRIVESEDVHSRVLRVRERVLGPDHPDTLESCHGLQQPLFRMRRRPEALSLLRRAANGLRSALGVEHPKALRSRAMLIEELATSGENEEFARVSPEIVVDCERHLGTDHPTSLSARHAYAFGVSRLGDPAEAEPLVRRVLADRERVQGDAHPMTLTVVVLLSQVLAKRGHWEEAVELTRRAIAGREQALPADSPVLVENYSQLADYLAHAGRVAEAEGTARVALPLCERVLGPDHPETLRARRVLAR
ncbi:tetratricopeptide repeat protein [Streptomyces rugosispiralis]|uniref:Tetratricopeptide repeat protein n=1 Tax=Streptomyces rugosispiralis TaxID=2967341 RepID=A0ABT1V833_9ACTN|nr:tetratricopeptide repeat protein [Streptomyces rugosispiralis]MCQ8193547.1 tetratricopeptide repeat protein [Streptomyces rugosispiralis]